VSNAGIQIVKPLVDFPFADWKKLLSIHLDAPSSPPRLPETHVRRQVRSRGLHGFRPLQGASKLKAPYVTAKHG